MSLVDIINTYWQTIFGIISFVFACGYTYSQMKEVARATAAKDPAITGPELYKYGKDILNRAELPIEEPKAASATPKVASAADVDATAKGQKITVDEAKKRLKAAGFKIEGEQ